MSKILSATNNSQTPFEQIKHLDENNQEYWLARELQDILQYANWQNFEEVIEKAKTACEKSENLINSHFTEGSKVVENSIIPRTKLDYELTRYACYLIAMNGDSEKEIIAKAQTYFAVQTRRVSSSGTNRYICPSFHSADAVKQLVRHEFC